MYGSLLQLRRLVLYKNQLVAKYFAATVALGMAQSWKVGARWILGYAMWPMSCVLMPLGSLRRCVRVSSASSVVPGVIGD